MRHPFQNVHGNKATYFHWTCSSTILLKKFKLFLMYTEWFKLVSVRVRYIIWSKIVVSYLIRSESSRAERSEPGWCRQVVWDVREGKLGHRQEWNPMLDRIIPWYIPHRRISKSNSRYVCILKLLEIWDDKYNRRYEWLCQEWHKGVIRNDYIF